MDLNTCLNKYTDDDDTRDNPLHTIDSPVKFMEMPNAIMNILHCI